MKTVPAHAMLPLLLALPACIWRTVDEQKQVESRSYVRLVGRTAGTTVTLTGKRTYTFEIEEDADQDGKRYAVDPGNYRLTVRRGDQVVVDRKLFLADGETREIRVG